jgi:EmrB/QacA subfamily drug resistance transporter
MSPDPSLRRRWLAVIVLLAAQVMIILDQNIVSIALPAIRDDLGFSESNLVWTVNAYVIPFGGLLLLAGRLSDLVSRKYVFLTGLLLFTSASLLCGLADSQSLLLAARFVQGIGGAVTAAGLLGMIVMTLPEPKEQAKAIGAIGFASAGGGAAGSVIGGVLTESLGWGWIFYINVPIGLLVAVLAWRLLHHDRGIGLRAGADVLGAVLVTSGVTIGVYALVGVEARGWDSPTTIGLGVVAVLLLAGFFARQATAATPLLPLRILKSRNVAGANLIQALMVGALFAFMFYTVLYMQRVLGFVPLEAGLAFLPVPAVIAVVSMALAPRLLTRFGPRPLVLVGLPILGGGMVLLAQISPDGGYLTGLLPAMLIMPIGFGITMPSLMTLAMSEVAPQDSGVTSGLFNTTQQVGGAVGLAVVSTAVASRIEGLLNGGAASPVALTGGYSLAFWIGSGFVFTGWLIAIVMLRGRTATVPDNAVPQAAAA